jgi:hypothetical protein
VSFREVDDFRARLGAVKFREVYELEANLGLIAQSEIILGTDNVVMNFERSDMALSQKVPEIRL